MGNLHLLATNALEAADTIVRHTEKAYDNTYHPRRYRVSKTVLTAGIATGVTIGLTAIPEILKNSSPSGYAISGLNLIGAIIGIVNPFIALAWETCKPEHENASAEMDKSIPRITLLSYTAEALALVASVTAQSIKTVTTEDKVVAGINLAKLIAGAVAPAVVAFNKVREARTSEAQGPTASQIGPANV